MANMPRTPTRTIRVHPVVWEAAKKRAGTEGTTITAVVVAFLERYAGTKTPQEPRAKRGTRTRPEQP